MLGTVRAYLPEKGFGFVQITDGDWTAEFFFHKSALVNGLVYRGMPVSFWLGDGRDGRTVAVEVAPIQEAEASD